MKYNGIRLKKKERRKEGSPGEIRCLTGLWYKWKLNIVGVMVSFGHVRYILSERDWWQMKIQFYFTLISSLKCVH